MKNNYKNQKGFGLIEMIIAVVIVGIGIVGIFSMISRFSEQSKTIRDNFVASYLSQEGIEIVKNIRDINKINGNTWTSGLANCHEGCEADYTSNSLVSATGKFFYIDNSTGRYSYDSTGDKIKTYYKRRITLAQNGDELDIMVDIYWEDKSTTTRSKIYNWEPWNQD
jgi:prepilin-type N-terminal cleavage/methylation domain-containing protein